MEKLHKIIVVFILCLTICILGGCVKGETISSIKNRSSELTNKVMCCIKDENGDELKNLFCQKILDEDINLDDEINDFFEFIKGNIISYGNPTGFEDGSLDGGEWTKYRINPQIRKIKTDEGYEYRIIYFSILVYKEDPDRIGISEITIRDENDDLCRIGDVYLVNPEL